ncbi:MAG: hypothetical protein ACRD22_19540 [Terriglobia bacterium]
MAVLFRIRIEVPVVAAPRRVGDKEGGEQTPSEGARNDIRIYATKLQVGTHDRPSKGFEMTCS